MEAAWFVLFCIVVYPFVYVANKVKDKVYVSDVRYHCWRLIKIQYELKGNEKLLLTDGISLNDRVQPWIERHNMHFYRCKVKITYQTLANPLFPGHGVESSYGMSAVWLAANVLDELTKSDDFSRLPYFVYKEERKKIRRLYDAF